jgi:uncharacterized protein
MTESSPRKSRGRETPRAWQRMLSGRRLDLLDPSPLDIEIADIAHGLARVARWNGQTEGAHIYSVAQHSLLVETIAHQTARLDRKRRLAVLLHDAPEYVIGDMITPFKAVIGDTYKAVETRILAAVHIRFGLPVNRNDQSRRSCRGLSRGHAPGRLLGGRGGPLLRTSAEVFPRHRARLPCALAGGCGGGALHGTLHAADARVTAVPYFHARACRPI